MIRCCYPTLADMAKTKPQIPLTHAHTHTSYQSVLVHAHIMMIYQSALVQLEHFIYPYAMVSTLLLSLQN